MTFEELEKEFAALSSPGIVPGLDRLFVLLPLLGNPQNAFPAVHVVGTNGKGSTCASLVSILKEAGYKTAVYTSPHLVSFSERLEIDGRRPAAEEWHNAAAEIKNALAKCSELADNRPTYFELITAAAFMLIAGNSVDIAVIEAGLGGRLDATNTLGNVALTLITPIGMDHMDYLGEDLLSIAGEKFAVIRGGVPAIFSCGEPELEEKFMRVAAEKKTDALLLRNICDVSDAVLSFSGTDFNLNYFGRKLRLNTPLIGRFQAGNAALAVCGACLLSGKYSPAAPPGFSNITDETIRAGIRKTIWPGRLEPAAQSPLLLLDGAHNPHAMSRLVETLSALAPGKPINIVLAMMKDKDVRGVLRLLKPLRPVVYCTQVPDMERSMTSGELRRLADGLSLETAGEYGCPAAAARGARMTGVTTVCCGSLYLVGYLKERLNDISGV